MPTQAGTKPTYANILDIQHGRASSASTRNSSENKGPHLRAFFGVVCKHRFGTALEALRMRRSFAGAGMSARTAPSLPASRPLPTMCGRHVTCSGSGVCPLRVRIRDSRCLDSAHDATHSDW